MVIGRLLEQGNGCTIIPMKSRTLARGGSKGRRAPPRKGWVRAAAGVGALCTVMMALQSCGVGSRQGRLQAITERAVVSIAHHRLARVWPYTAGSFVLIGPSGSPMSRTKAKMWLETEPFGPGWHAAIRLRDWSWTHPDADTYRGRVSAILVQAGAPGWRGASLRIGVTWSREGGGKWRCTKASWRPEGWSKIAFGG